MYFRSLCGVALAAFLSAPLLTAQSQTRTQTQTQTGQRQTATMPSYQTRTETTIQGKVQNVQQNAGANRDATHVTVRTDDGKTMTVYLGPTQYLNQQGFKVNTGDEVRISGSRVTSNGSQLLLARQVKRQDQTLTLRDTGGNPQWAGRMQMGEHQLQSDATITGTIREVRRTSRGEEWRGMQAMLRTDNNETVAVFLGPAGFYEAQGVELKPGDQIQVSGCRLSYEGGSAVLAREIKKGGRTISLVPRETQQQVTQRR